MSLSRRDVLKAALLAPLLVGRSGGYASASRSRANRRRFVMLHMWGGIDPIYTIDPKTVRDCAPNVDVPYASDAIVSSGDVALGPHYAALAPWASRLAIMKGVGLATVAHDTGVQQLMRLKLDGSDKMPSILEVIGTHRESQPVGVVAMTDGTGQFYTPHSFGDVPLDNEGRSTLERLDVTPSDELLNVAHAMMAQASRIDASLTPARANTRLSLEESAAFFSRFATTPRFRQESWGAPADSTEAWNAVRLQRVLWLLENDLTRSVFHTFVYDWDSHDRNAARQEQGNQMAGRLFARFLTELTRRRNSDGVLADNTVVLLGSEMGRFPYLNRVQGKDHLPEASYVLFGSGIRPGVYGRTGEQMQALPISTRTGRDVSTGGHRVVLDDLGITLLHLADMNPTLYGYTGRSLDFLLA